MTSLQLSRYKLQAFLTCQRRFQLRYVSRMTWPTAPIVTALSDAFAQGELFHRLMEQHFRGLGVTLPAEADDTVKLWWDNFRRLPPDLPSGDRYPELGLSVPIAPIDLDGKHYLFGRFDLLILTPTSAHIYDWKTERKPRSRGELAADWQTRLYQTMVVEGSAALGRSYKPEQVHMTYWFAAAPEQSVTIDYTQQAHARNWAELRATVERIDRRMVAANAVWPLTDNHDHCETCEFAAFCGRTVALKEPDTAALDMLREEGLPSTILEPVPSNTVG